MTGIETMLIDSSKRKSIKKNSKAEHIKLRVKDNAKVFFNEGR